MPDNRHNYEHDDRPRRKRSRKDEDERYDNGDDRPQKSNAGAIIGVVTGVGVAVIVMGLWLIGMVTRGR